MFEKLIGSWLFAPLNWIASEDTETSLPSTLELTGEATLKRIDSPVLSEAISCDIDACSGTSKSTTKARIVIEILFIAHSLRKGVAWKIL